MFSLDFTEGFFYGEGYTLDEPPERSDRPTSVLQALISLSEEELNQICIDVMPETPEHLQKEHATDCDLKYFSYDSKIAYLLDMVRHNGSCRDLSPPVEVYIDKGGWCSIRVYEPEENS